MVAQEWYVRYAVNPAIFNKLCEFVSGIMETKKNVLNFKVPSGINRKAFYSKVNGVEWLLVQTKYLLQVVKHNIKSNNYYCLVKCDESVSSIEEVFVVPFLHTCKKYMMKVLTHDYTEEEIEQLMYEHEVEGHIKTLQQRLPYIYPVNQVCCFRRCIYYDINNAHLDALVEIFPKAEYELKKLRTFIAKMKKEGKKNDALRVKYYINIFVGGMGQRKYVDENGNVVYEKHRKTYEWVVDRTRKKLTDIIEKVQGTVLYANTDGVMIKEPKHLLTPSEALGECKLEMNGDTIYAFVYAPSKEEKQQGYTPYFCYQYINAKGEKEIKGNVAHEVREFISLDKGEYPVYKKKRCNGYYIYEDVELRNGEIKEYE